jgi:hypothetical protein
MITFLVYKSVGLALFWLERFASLHLTVVLASKCPVIPTCAVSFCIGTDA